MSGQLFSNATDFRFVKDKSSNLCTVCSHNKMGDLLGRMILQPCLSNWWPGK